MTKAKKAPVRSALKKFRVWIDGKQHLSRVLAARDEMQAIDLFCAGSDYANHADYCKKNHLKETNIKTELA